MLFRKNLNLFYHDSERLNINHANHSLKKYLTFVLQTSTAIDYTIKFIKRSYVFDNSMG